MTMPQNYFTVSLSRSAHQQAQQSYQYQSRSQKAKQAYLNQLAIHAVDYYLSCLGFETNRTQSSNPILQILSNTADIFIENFGKVECCPVLPNEDSFVIVPEAWQNRKGYIAVQFNAELTEANLLGFVAEASQPKIAFGKLRSLDELLEHLYQPNTVLENKFDLSNGIVRLSSWLNNIADSGWETLENLVTPSQSQLAFRSRNSAMLRHRKPNPVKVERGKLINLEKNGDRVALLVGLLPESHPKLDISVELLPGNHNYLPSDLQLIILDEGDRAVMQAQAGGSEGLEFQFSGEPGEQFSVKVTLGEFSIVEQFIV
ncbi:MAG: DUF1822 family protein [Jaaginema sp. PMC 1079.18]|nr:DUF1822 family protein [Jaaginema sp. PMC 1080.18]MEC4849953.1 DUF1822 family protein [Jaaginema sp. PMC 1079.18]MEC4866145.1 DUF1822 family protein [Jaaginema sp. PMC 1078.18]